MQRIIITREPIEQCLQNNTKTILLSKSFLVHFMRVQNTRFAKFYNLKTKIGCNQYSQPLFSSSPKNNEINNTCQILFWTLKNRLGKLDLSPDILYIPST